jgi:hypothetical protein
MGNFYRWFHRMSMGEGKKIEAEEDGISNRQLFTFHRSW